MGKVTADEVARVASKWNLRIEEHEASEYEALVSEALESIDRVAALLGEELGTGTERSGAGVGRAWSTVPAEENKLNAWIVRCSIQEKVGELCHVEISD